MQPQPHQPRSTVAAVILAAGAGTRFAGDDHKLLTVVNGKTILRHSIDAAVAAELDEVVVVSGAIDLANEVPDTVTLIHNEKWEDGQATSLQAAVAYADSRGHAAVVVGLGDSPGISPETWRKVAEVPNDLAMARFDGELRPPTRLSAAMWASLPVAGDEGARALVRHRPDQVRPVPIDKEFGDNPTDIDTLEDLRRWS